jgi:8-oxo-dGTP pyrophosphatase MutT (NUDIX family)
MSYADLEHRLRVRLHPLDALTALPERGDNDLNPQWKEFRPLDLKPAAVLAPIVRRPEGWTLMFTQRTHEMPSHPGQISFPGGRVQAEDADAVATALRETREEIGLEHSFIRPLGVIDPYVTGTGYRIIPVIAFIEPGFELTPDPREVAEVFETPLDFLFDPANHHLHEGEWRGRKGRYYEMPYQGRRIWGATAGMIRALYERLYG